MLTCAARGLVGLSCVGRGRVGRGRVVQGPSRAKRTGPVRRLRVTKTARWGQPWRAAALRGGAPQANPRALAGIGGSAWEQRAVATRDGLRG